MDLLHNVQVQEVQEALPEGTWEQEVQVQAQLLQHNLAVLMAAVAEAVAEPSEAQAED